MSTPTRPFGRKQPPAPLPDARSSYEPLLKRELARRLTVICATFLVFTSLTLLISTFDLQRGPPLGLFGHLVAIMLMALFVLVVGAVPSLILRGRGVSVSGIPPLTRAAAFLALVSSPRTWRTLASFASSGFGLTLLYVAFINMSEWEDSRLSVFAPTRRNTYRLNERFFYLAFFNASLGLLFGSRDILKRRWVTKWPRVSDVHDINIAVTSPYILEALLAALNHRALLSTAIITTTHALLFPLLYHSIVAIALPLLRNLPAISWISRPLLHGFGRTWVIDVSWSRIFALGFKTSLGWELVESSFDYWSVKPIVASRNSQDPNQILVAGLHSQDRYFKHHAYLELSVLAASPSAAFSARRIALFTDSKTSPTLWNSLLRELLITLGRHYQLLLQRGNPPPTPAPKPQQGPFIPRTPRKPSTPLLRQQVLKPSPRAFFDKFASESLDTQSQPTNTNHADHVEVPGVFLSSMPSTPGAATKTVVKTTESKATAMSQIAQRMRNVGNWAVMGMLGWVEGALPSELRAREWWSDVSVENAARGCLPESELDAAGISALSHLIAASLTEDTLGIVQRDIPRVLEAMLSFLGEAERYKAELEAKLAVVENTGGSSPGDMHALKAAEDIAQAVEVVSPMIVALRAGIGLIARTFGKRLSVYKFPPVTAKRLQDFMEYL